MIDTLIDCGIDKAKAEVAINKEYLKITIVSGYESSAIFLGECAEGINYATIVLLVKDVLTIFSGTRTRTDAYMNIAAMQGIYLGELNAYKIASKEYKTYHSEKYGDIAEGLFYMMLATQQEAYDSIEDLVGKDGLRTRLNSNPAFKTRYNKIQKITIQNYQKEKLYIKLDKMTITIYIGQINPLKADVSSTITSQKSIVWASSNKNIATVSESGIVTGKKAGTCTITASYNLKSEL